MTLRGEGEDCFVNIEGVSFVRKRLAHGLPCWELYDFTPL